MTRHEKLIEMMILNKISMFPGLTKNDEDLRHCAAIIMNDAEQYIKATEQRRLMIIFHDSEEKLSSLTVIACCRNPGHHAYFYKNFNELIGSITTCILDDDKEIIINNIPENLNSIYVVHCRVIKSLQAIGYFQAKRAEKLMVMTPVNL